MKNLFFLILLMLLPYLSFSQAVEIEWGEANKNESFTNRILGETDYEVITLASRKEDFYIETYDKKTLKLKNSAPFKLPKEMDKKTEIEKIHFFPETDKIVLFTSLYLDKTNNIYFYSIDTKANVSKSTLLLSIDVEKKGRKGRFGFDISIDENTVLVYHTSKLKKEKVKQVRVKVINSDVELVADMEDKIPMKDDKKELYVEDFTFDPNGYIHMLIVKPTKQYKDFFFYTYDSNDGYKRKTYQVELDKDHIVNTIAFAINSQNNLVAAGYYSDFAGVFRGLTIQGVFSFEYNPLDNRVLSKMLSPYNQKDYQNAYGKQAKRFKKGIPPNHYMRELILKSDGSLSLVSEYYQVTQSSSGIVSTVSYIYGDILVTDLDSKGNINWLQSIPKIQVFTRPSLNISFSTSGGFATLGFSIALMKDKSVFLSYLLSVQEDKIYFVYNDNPKNLEIPLDEKPKIMKNLNKGTPTLISMDQTGFIKREALPGAKNDELVLRPRINKEVDSNTIYVYGNKKKLDKIGRLIFK